MRQRRRILACVASPLEKEKYHDQHHNHRHHHHHQRHRYHHHHHRCAEVDACFKAIDIAMIMQVMNTITTAIGIASMIKNDDNYDDADAV